MELQYDIRGLAEIQRVLRELPRQLALEALLPALQEGAAVVAREAKARVPVRTGLLRRAIAVGLPAGQRAALRAARRTTAGIVAGLEGAQVLVGIRGGRAKVIGVRTRGRRRGRPIYVQPSRYAHLVEFGTRRSAARPFLRPALDAAAPEAITRIAMRLRQEVIAAAERLAGPSPFTRRRGRGR